jgi:hypothetical protein
MDTKPFVTPETKADLEDAFFAEQDQDLVKRLRSRKQREATKEALAKVSAIKDDAILEKLVQLDIGPGALIALSLIPLVEVAWADGHVTAKERQAILAAADEKGVRQGTDEYRLLEGWLMHAAGQDRLDAWIEYTRAAMQAFSADERRRLRDAVLGRAREIAEAAGGVLGVGSISKSEKAVLDRLAKAF